MAPTTITEENGRYVIHNARPRGMRVTIAIFAPVAIAFVVLSLVGDVHDHRWIMVPVRLGFAGVIALAAMFALFGSESLAVEGGELVWRRGSSQERRCKLGDVEWLERQGNHLRVHVKGEPHPIIVGAGLRQPAEAMEWLAERLAPSLTGARKDK
jgi:hypothetical protein